MPMALNRGTVVCPMCPAPVIPLTAAVGPCPLMPVAPATQQPAGTTGGPAAPCDVPPGARPPIAVNCAAAAAGEQLEMIGG